MRISLITDEISADPETAIELGTEWGIHDFELRGFFVERVPRLTRYQEQHLRDVLAENEARLIAISPGLFKMPFPLPRAPRLALGWMEKAGYESWAEAKRLIDRDLDEGLPASIDFANAFGATVILIFGFDRGGAPAGRPPAGVLDCLRRAAERASAAGLLLCVENEAGFWADTGAHTAEIVRAVNNPFLAVNWDPGNAFCAGDEPYPSGYQEVRDLVRHVHFKDARRHADGTAEYVVEGEIDWPGQIKALSEDRYDGFISIETHTHPKVASARVELSRLRSMVSASTAGKPGVRSD